MTIQKLRTIERELKKKCPKPILFTPGTLYSVVESARNYENRLEEEVLADGPRLKVTFKIRMNEDGVQEWTIDQINGWNWREFID